MKDIYLKILIWNPIGSYFRKLSRALTGIILAQLHWSLQKKETCIFNFISNMTEKRTTTLARDLGLSTEYCFDKVKSAKGSWSYCTGTGKYEDKPAVSRMSFGDPILYGDDQRADLQHLVSLVIDGVELGQLMKEYPYAWCVHRDRIMKFYNDWTFGISHNNNF